MSTGIYIEVTCLGLCRSGGRRDYRRGHRPGLRLGHGRVNGDEHGARDPRWGEWDVIDREDAQQTLGRLK